MHAFHPVTSQQLDSLFFDWAPPRTSRVNTIPSFDTGSRGSVSAHNYLDMLEVGALPTSAPSWPLSQGTVNYGLSMRSGLQRLTTSRQSISTHRHRSNSKRAQRNRVLKYVGGLVNRMSTLVFLNALKDYGNESPLREVEAAIRNGAGELQDTSIFLASPPLSH